MLRGWIDGFQVEWRIRATESCLATVCLGLARQTSSCPKEFDFEHHGHVVRGEVDRVRWMAVETSKSVRRSEW